VKLLAPTSPTRWPFRAVVAIVTLLCACAAACIIGPKQDDPATAELGDDAGIVDTSPGANDTATTTPTSDTAPALDQDAVADAAPATDTAMDGEDDASGTCPDAADGGDADDAACEVGGSDALAAD
jgi:hypothetical protein